MGFASKIQNIFRTREVSEVSEEATLASIGANPTESNPLIEKFGRSITRDCIVLRGLNGLACSEDPRLRGQAYRTLAALAEKIANCENGYLQAAREYNKYKFDNVVDKHGRIDFEALLSMTPFELHFFVHILTNFDNRHNVLAIHKGLLADTSDRELVDVIRKCLQPDTPTLASYLEEEGKLLLEAADRQEGSTKFHTPELSTSETRRRQSSTLSEDSSLNPLANVELNTVVRLSRSNTVETVEEPDTQPLLLNDLKDVKSASFFTRFMDRLLGRNPKSVHDARYVPSEKPAIWEKLKAWWSSIFDK